MFVRSILVTKLMRILMILNQNTLARNPGKWSQNINVRKLFKGGNYSREETIQGRKLFKGGNYMRKYGITN